MGGAPPDQFENMLPQKPHDDDDERLVYLFSNIKHYVPIIMSEVKHECRVYLFGMRFRAKTSLVKI